MTTIEPVTDSAPVSTTLDIGRPMMLEIECCNNNNNNNNNNVPLWVVVAVHGRC